MTEQTIGLINLYENLIGDVSFDAPQRIAEDFIKDLGVEAPIERHTHRSREDGEENWTQHYTLQTSFMEKGNKKLIEALKSLGWRIASRIKTDRQGRTSYSREQEYYGYAFKITMTITVKTEQVNKDGLIIGSPEHIEAEFQRVTAEMREAGYAIDTERITGLHMDGPDASRYVVGVDLAKGPDTVVVGHGGVGVSRMLAEMPLGAIESRMAAFAEQVHGSLYPFQERMLSAFERMGQTMDGLRSMSELMPADDRDHAAIRKENKSNMRKFLRKRYK